MQSSWKQNPGARVKELVEQIFPEHQNYLDFRDSFA